VRQGQIFEMCITKTASKEKRKPGFSFAAEAVWNFLKIEKKLANSNLSFHQPTNRDDHP
jgi:hypothetical protein